MTPQMKHNMRTVRPRYCGKKKKKSVKRLTADKRGFSITCYCTKETNNVIMVHVQYSI